MMHTSDLYFWNWSTTCCVDARSVYGIYSCIVLIGFSLFAGYMRMTRSSARKQAVSKEEQNEGCGELKPSPKPKYPGEVCS